MRESFVFLGMETDHGIGFWAIIFLIAPLAIRLAWDGHEILVCRREVNHGKHTTATAFFIFVAAFAVWLIEPVKTVFQPFMLSWGIFWMFFDYGLNIIRGKRILYIDLGTDGKQSFFDSIYEKLGPYPILGAKLWFLLLTFSIYFYWTLITGTI